MGTSQKIFDILKEQIVREIANNLKSTFKPDVIV